MIVAHLGSGASLCAISDGKPLDTTMGFSPSGDMQALLTAADRDGRTREAGDLFVYQLIKHLGAFVAVLGGLDALVFTGGIGAGSFAARKYRQREGHPDRRESHDRASHARTRDAHLAVGP